MVDALHAFDLGVAAFAGRTWDKPTSDASAEMLETAMKKFYLETYVTSNRERSTGWPDHRAKSGSNSAPRSLRTPARRTFPRCHAPDQRARGHVLE